MIKPVKTIAFSLDEEPLLFATCKYLKTAVFYSNLYFLCPNTYACPFSFQRTRYGKKCFSFTQWKLKLGKIAYIISLFLQ